MSCRITEHVHVQSEPTIELVFTVLLRNTRGVERGMGIPNLRGSEPIVEVDIVSDGPKLGIKNLNILGVKQSKKKIKSKKGHSSIGPF
jgi:hypothetical protein